MSLLLNLEGKTKLDLSSQEPSPAFKTILRYLIIRSRWARGIESLALSYLDLFSTLESINTFRRNQCTLVSLAIAFSGASEVQFPLESRQDPSFDVSACTSAF